MPGPHAIALLIVTVGAFYLYTRPWIRMEMVSLLLIASLLVIFHWFPYSNGGSALTDQDVFQSFGHPALVAICSLMILARGLTVTGALEPAVRLLSRLWRWNFWLGLLVTLLMATLASAFINDTPVLVLMLPMLLGIAARTGHTAAKSLMPVNFAILMGGMLTTIGTSTNVLVLSIATELGMRPMPLFGFTSISAAALLVALPYLWLVAPHLLRDRGARHGTEARLYHARMRVPDAGSPLAGQSIEGLGRALGRPMPVACVLRGTGELPPQDLLLLPGDSLVLQDSAAGLKEVASAFRLDLFDRAGEGRFVEDDASKVEVELAEFVVGNESPLVARSLSAEQFARQHRVVVVGLSRGTEDILRQSRKLGDVPLAAGDILLAQGPRAELQKLRSVGGLLMLDGSLALPRLPLARTALAIMVAVIACAALKWLPIHVAAFLGVIAMLVTRCVHFEGLGRALSLEVILLVASSIALGRSLVVTGAADWIAGGVAAALRGIPSAWQLAGFMAFAALLTNFVSNSAAAAVGTPIAIAAAKALGAPLEPFVLAILFGANLSFATPMAYQTNLLVMNAAGYRFSDFVRAGLPLVLLMLATLSWLLVRAYAL